MLATYFLNALLHTVLLLLLLLFDCFFSKKKNEYDFDTVRGILCNTDVITSIVKLIVNSPVGQLV